jgi:hypothetical protein
MGDIGQQAWRLVARRSDDVALERSQGGLHQGAPSVLIPLCINHMGTQRFRIDELCQNVQDLTKEVQELRQQVGHNNQGSLFDRGDSL